MMTNKKRLVTFTTNELIFFAFLLFFTLIKLYYTNSVSFKFLCCALKNRIKHRLTRVIIKRINVGVKAKTFLSSFIGI